MTTAREVKKLVSPLLAKNDDLILIGRAIVFRPVKHVLRGVYIDRTSSADLFYVALSVISLFFRQDDFTMKRDGAIYPPHKKLWLISDPEVSETLCKQIEDVALPRLRALGSDLDYIRSRQEKDPYTLNRAAPTYALYRIAEGNLDAARDLIVTSEYASHFWLPHLKRLGLDEKLLTLGNKLPHADRLTLAGLLHEWEAYSVEKLKLGKIWERAPFPLETMPS
ncbi:hypothetical protein [Roseixanthobacter pseudopolyaromaticivorans]|uniref:hypothetical protein n=1 Tax=Xanthobacteraceae TaxID=335928 RepID=UPI00372C77B5